MKHPIGRNEKLVVTLIVDALLAQASLFLSYLFLKDLFEVPASNFWALLPLSSVLLVTAFFITGVYRTVIRYAGSMFFIKTIVCSFVISGLLATVALSSVYGESQGGFPRTIFVLYAIILSVGTACSRLAARFFFDRQSPIGRTNAIIYGAGSAGYQLYSSLRYGGDYAPVAFVDDNPLTRGRAIHSLKVYPIDKLQKLINTKKVKTVLLAMPSIDHEKRMAIIKKLQGFGVSIKTTPNLSDIISGKANLSDLHNISVVDLMSRPAVEANEEMAHQCVDGKSVLVTGAGGSIGSELCRQIIKRSPQKIILFEMTESALFYIEQELISRVKKQEESVEIVAVLGSILDTNRVKEIIARHEVDSVFHAAAYKHVPMLENNPVEGVRNNVLGTKSIAEAAVWGKVTSLVVVSTDKAVRPTNLMGATKRFAELIVQSITKSSPVTSTCMVRFGNVLGSSGSVVPTFKEQIKNGGPITVTDPEITRYFMTIPEASQLVLQAGAMAKDSEIFVLDMGESVKIYDLAKRMIELSGHSVLDKHNPEGDIEIVFTGLRPGEKMYEELSFVDKLEKTKHPKISRSVESPQQNTDIMALTTKLDAALSARDDDQVIQIVCEAVPEYTSSL